MAIHIEEHDDRVKTYPCSIATMANDIILQNMAGDAVQSFKSLLFSSSSCVCHEVIVLTFSKE